MTAPRNIGLAGLSLTCIASTIPVSTAPLLAQSVIVTDGTLAGNASTVQQLPLGQTELIEGGLASDINLFHSFEQFNVAEGWQVYFISPNSGIENILARVTGSQTSEIAGLLGTGQLLTSGQRIASDTNLFLLNPNGIRFGPNAQLDVGSTTRGDFVAATVSDIVWPDGSQFSAIAPGNSNALLNIVGDPSGFLAQQQPAGAIAVNGSALALQPGQSLGLLGGDIAIENSQLLAPSGTISLAGLAVGEADWDDNLLSLGDGVGRSPIQITTSELNVQGDAGTLALTGSDIDISASSLLAGIPQLGGFSGAQAGPILFNASETITIGQQSEVFNDISNFATGDGGDILIEATVLEVNDGSQITASLESGSVGDAGDITVTARDRVTFQGTSPTGELGSGIYSNVRSVTEGQGGALRVTAPVVEVLGGAQLSTSTFSDGGDAGNIRISARDSIRIQGENPTFVLEGLTPVSAVLSRTFFDRRGGDIELDTNRLELLDGGQVFTDTFQNGPAGNITLTAREQAILQGTDREQTFPSGAITIAGFRADADGGNITVNTPLLQAIEGGRLLAFTIGQGDAGLVEVNAQNVVLQGTSPDGTIRSGIDSIVRLEASGKAQGVVVTTDTLDVIDGAQVLANTLGPGDAGLIQINARERASFRGTNADGSIGSGAFSGVGPEGSGQGGGVIITTPLLELFDGAQVAASTEGQGDAGSVRIESDRILLQGKNALNSLKSSAIGSTVEPGAEGNGSTIEIQTGTLEILDGAQLLTTTNGRGNAGPITINATDQLTIRGIPLANPEQRSTDPSSNSTISSSVQPLGEGLGGDIVISADTLAVLSDGSISAQSLGQGAAGNITITTPQAASLDNGLILLSGNEGNAAGNLSLTAESLTLSNFSQIITESVEAQGGNISLTLADTLLLQGGSFISAASGIAEGNGDGGNISIDANFVSAVADSNSDIIANAFSGTGGQVNITAESISNFASSNGQSRAQLRGNRTNDISASSDSGTSGTVTLDSPFIDPSRGTSELPTELRNPSEQISQRCAASTVAQSQFVITGRGGLPQSPADLPELSSIPVDWVPLPQAVKARQAQIEMFTQPRALAEASFWTVGTDGAIALLTNQSQSAPPWGDRDCHTATDYL